MFKTADPTQWPLWMRSGLFSVFVYPGSADRTVFSQAASESSAANVLTQQDLEPITDDMVVYPKINSETLSASSTATPMAASSLKPRSITSFLDSDSWTLLYTPMHVTVEHRSYGTGENVSCVSRPSNWVATSSITDVLTSSVTMQAGAAQDWDTSSCTVAKRVSATRTVCACTRLGLHAVVVSPALDANSSTKPGPKTVLGVSLGMILDNIAPVIIIGALALICLLAVILAGACDAAALRNSILIAALKWNRKHLANHPWALETDPIALTAAAAASQAAARKAAAAARRAAAAAGSPNYGPRSSFSPSLSHVATGPGARHPVPPPLVLGGGNNGASFGDMRAGPKSMRSGYNVNNNNNNHHNYNQQPQYYNNAGQQNMRQGFNNGGQYHYYHGGPLPPPSLPPLNDSPIISPTNGASAGQAGFNPSLASAAVLPPSRAVPTNGRSRTRPADTYQSDALFHSAMSMFQNKHARPQALSRSGGGADSRSPTPPSLRTAEQMQMQMPASEAQMQYQQQQQQQQQIQAQMQQQAQLAFAQALHENMVMKQKLQQIHQQQQHQQQQQLCEREQ